jgi:hypothetical protein
MWLRAETRADVEADGRAELRPPAINYLFFKKFMMIDIYTGQDGSQDGSQSI